MRNIQMYGRDIKIKLKVLIVDDEIYICKLIRSLIEWEGLNLTCLTPCQSADEAMVAIEYQMPNIVITDIRLGDKDGKDGLELARLLSEQYSDIRCILISGYQRFEYAQNAIKYGVKDYLLKPVNREELNHCLEAAVRDIRAHLLQIEEVPSSKSAREYFLLKLAYKNQDFITCTLTEVNEKYAYHFSDSCFLLGILKLDDVGRVCGRSEAAFEKIKKLFRRVFEEICSDLEIVLENADLEKFIFLLNYSRANRSKAASRLLRFRELVALMAKRRREICVTISKYELPFSVEGLVQAYSACTALAAGRIMLGADRILEANERAGLPEDEKIGLEPEKYNLSHYIDILDLDGIRESCISVFREAYSRFERSPHKVTDWFYEFFTFFISCMKRHHADFERKGPEEYSFIQEIRHYPSLKILEEKFLEEVSGAIRGYLENKQKPVNQMIQEINKYIYNNYPLKISLDSIARHVHLSSAYLGILYKKETKTNITDAIAMVRIEKAKEKISQSDDSIAEIAVSVGYKDIKSFRRQFLKNVGVTPSEYREFHR
ncbi:response regulator [Lacrimispora sp. NSJ-141]|uniref:Stage 0 sporulation protein A homolog n=1 Tax=Lientehia hominis TaxID=2897778 RepID=A0AAP2RKY7_9FIRM|nr:response regulator [Lientehia hominis]MCD2493686.1 response regulator [Lientehia hominis]